jgi:PiT family inorganic phosphate transporter
MGIITLALIAHGTLSPGDGVPAWAIVSAALAIGLGTYVGGWRIIRTLGTRLTEITPPQGFAADSAMAAVILSASHYGFPLSTTHVASGSIIGSGVGRRLAHVRWSIAGRMVTAWVLTLPAAAIVGGLVFWLSDTIGGTTGVAVVGGLFALGAIALWLAARRDPVTPANVTA